MKKRNLVLMAMLTLLTVMMLLPFVYAENPNWSYVSSSPSFEDWDALGPNWWEDTTLYMASRNSKFQATAEKFFWEWGFWIQMEAHHPFLSFETITQDYTVKATGIEKNFGGSRNIGLKFELIKSWHTTNWRYHYNVYQVIDDVETYWCFFEQNINDFPITLRWSTSKSGNYWTNFEVSALGYTFDRDYEFFIPEPVLTLDYHQDAAQQGIKVEGWRQNEYYINSDPKILTITIYYPDRGYTIPSAGVHEYLVGTEVDITAYPFEGYHFGFWTMDGWHFYVENPLEVTMNDDHSVIAWLYEDYP